MQASREASRAVEALSWNQIEQAVEDHAPPTFHVGVDITAEPREMMVSGVEALDLEQADVARSLVQESDEIAEALAAAAHRVVTSDLDQASQEAVLGVLSKVAERFGVELAQPQTSDEAAGRAEEGVDNTLQSSRLIDLPHRVTERAPEGARRVADLGRKIADLKAEIRKRQGRTLIARPTGRKRRSRRETRFSRFVAEPTEE